MTLNGIEIKSSPDWLQKRLTAVGVRPINNIVDATNYAMLETGQPLHAYDRACVETDTFIIRKAHAGEKLETLDHKIRMLSPDDAVVDNGKKLLGLAGIMGGIDSEISPDTKQIILESANWNPIIIRKTSQRLNIRTEASQRFEKNLDPVTHHQGFLRCLQLILELCPAAGIEGKIQDLNYYQWNQPQITLRIPNLNSKIGKKIPPQKIERILKSLEFTVEKTDSKTFLVNVPSFRATKDISNEYDLIEEVARLYGYENIPPHIPTLPIRLPEENIERRRKHETRAILSSMLGFNEVYNYSFYSRKDFAKTLLPEENHLTVENYLSEDQTHLRISLLPQLLKNCFENAKFYQQVKLFEIGRVYHKSENYFPSEEKWLAALLYRTEKTESPFYPIKGALEAMLKRLITPPYKLIRNTQPKSYFHPNKTVDIIVAEEKVGMLGEINPIVQMNFEIKNPVGYFELNLAQLVHLGKPEVHYVPTPKFPGLDFDISVIVNEKTEVAEIEKIIQLAEPEIINEIALFDVFTGGVIEQGKKALAFHILLQSPHRTLTDQEMEHVQKRIFENLTKHGGQIRGY